MKPEYPDSVIEQALAEASKQALQAQIAELIKQHGLVAVLEEAISMEGLVPVVAALKECVPNEVVVAENDARRTWDRLDSIAQRVQFLERG